MLHMVKLCVGAGSVEDLARWQEASMAQARAEGREPRIRHVTRSAPKRADELLDGGSLYWIVKGAIQCRQRILGIGQAAFSDGVSRCVIEVDPEIHLTAIAPRRPFQGWRYLETAAAPRDLAGAVGAGERAEDAVPMPEALRQELARLGIL